MGGGKVVCVNKFITIYDAFFFRFKFKLFLCIYYTMKLEVLKFSTFNLRLLFSIVDLRINNHPEVNDACKLFLRS